MTLALGALAAVLLAWIAWSAGDELSHQSVAPAGSDSAEARAALTRGLGFDPVPVAAIVLQPGAQPVSAASAEVTIDTVISQIGTIDGVGSVAVERGAGVAAATLLRVHTTASVDPEDRGAIVEVLESEIDAGGLEIGILAETGYGEEIEATIRDQAPERLLVALGALAVVLLLGLGLWAGAGVLLAVTASAAAAAAIVVGYDAIDPQPALALGLALILAALLAAEAGCHLVRRYREEAALLGAGPEALEYTAEVSTRGLLAGALSVSALAVAAIVVVPLELVDAAAIASLAASLAALLLTPPLTLAGLARTEGLRRSKALPLVPEGGRPDGAGPAFRFALLIGRRRLPALLVFAAGVAAIVLALTGRPDLEAIEAGPSELGADSGARIASDRIAGSFAAGAASPLVIAADAPAASPLLELHREAVAGLQSVSTVGEAQPAGSELSAVSVTLARLPGSLAAQVGADAVRGADLRPEGSTLAGAAAELGDRVDESADSLPLAALIGLGFAALLLAAWFRSAQGVLLAVATVPGVLAAIGVLWLVFGEGRATGALDYEPLGAPHLGSYVFAAVAVAAVSLFRTAGFAGALREERLLGGGATGSLARSTVLSLAPAIGSTLAGLALAGAWIGSDVVVVKEVAVAIAAGLVADLVVSRLLLAPAAARVAP